MIKWILNLSSRFGITVNNPDASLVDGLGLPIETPRELIDIIEYPARPRGIKTHPHKDILSLHKSSLHDVHMLLSLPDNIPGDDAYTFSNLVMKPLEEFTKYVHLLPASENHHHSGIGGLLSHSIAVGLMALKEAYRKELPAVSYQDNERIRKSRYLYASFICGLLHDAGKIFDLDVVAVSNEQKKDTNCIWSPLEESLSSWAKRNKVLTYEIIWRKRVVNGHNVRTSIFFERCMNKTCRRFLSDVATDRIYDSMLSAASNYMHQNSFISDSVRAADYYSTGTDLNVIAHPIMGSRSMDAVVKALLCIRSNIRHLTINDSTDRRKPPHLFVIGSEVYITRDACLTFVLSEFKKDEFVFPEGDIGIAALEESLILKGYVEPYSEERYFHSFHPGEYLPREVIDKMRMGNANLSWYSLLKLRWVGLVFDSFVIPDSVPGIFTVNEVHDYMYVNRSGDTVIYERSAAAPLNKLESNPHNQTNLKEAFEQNSEPVPQSSKLVEQSTNTSDEVRKDVKPSKTKNKSKRKNSNENVDPFSRIVDVTSITDTKDVSPTIDQPEQGDLPVPIKDSYQELLLSDKLTEDDLSLIDGVLYVDISFFDKHALPPVLSELIKSKCFVLSQRDGMLEPEIVVPTVQGRNVSQLSSDIASTVFENVDLTHIVITDIADVFSDDIFAPIATVASLNPETVPCVKPVIPQERHNSINEDKILPGSNLKLDCQISDNTSISTINDDTDPFRVLGHYEDWLQIDNSSNLHSIQTEMVSDVELAPIVAVGESSLPQAESDVPIKVVVSSGTEDPALINQAYEEVAITVHRIIFADSKIVERFIRGKLFISEQSLFIRTNFWKDSACFTEMKLSVDAFTSCLNQFPTVQLERFGRSVFYVINLDHLIEAGFHANIDVKSDITTISGVLND